MKWGISMVNQPYSASKEFFRGAFILSIAAIMVKVLSAAYRIPYQNIVGDIGFYIYQQVYPFYGIVLTLSTLGFPIVISKLIAEGKFAQRDILAASFLMLGTIALVSSTSLFLGADWLANKMADPRLAELLKVLSLSYLLMPLAAVFRGYFQGNHEMLPTASSQVAEQFVRVLTILVFTPILIHQGYSLYDAGAGAVFGSITGGLMGLILLLIFFVRYKKRKRAQLDALQLRQFPLIMKVLIFQGLAFCISSLILVFLQLVDSLHLYALLRQAGIAEMTAKEWKGIYDRGQPLLQLGTVVANSLSLALVPLIARYGKNQGEQELLSKIRLSLRVSLMIGSAATVGLICLIKPVNKMLYTDSLGSVTLAIFSVSIVLSSLIMTMAAVIQSLGHYIAPIFIVAAGVVGKWLLDVWLIPHYHINGAAVATVLSLLGMTIGFSCVLKNDVKQSLWIGKDIGIVMLSVGCMACTLWGFNMAADWLVPSETRMTATIQALLGVVLGALVFGVIILRTGLFKQDELMLLPFGNQLERLNKWNRSNE